MFLFELVKKLIKLAESYIQSRLLSVNFVSYCSNWSCSEIRENITRENLMEFFKKSFDDFKILLKYFFVHDISLSTRLFAEYGHFPKRTATAEFNL